jgi:hypothetical protein
MRTSLFVAALALLGMAVPNHASAYVVVRAGVYVRPVAVVAVAPVYYAPPPTTVVVTSQAVPAPAPAPALTTQLPLNTTMWTLPSGCSKVSAANQAYFLCGPNWLKAYPGVNGTPSYYGVVAPP